MRSGGGHRKQRSKYDNSDNKDLIKPDIISLITGHEPPGLKSPSTNWSPAGQLDHNMSYHTQWTYVNNSRLPMT